MIKAEDFDEDNDDPREIIDPAMVVKNFNKLTKSSCKVCAHSNRFEWEDKIINHKATRKDAAKDMDVSEQMMSEHMRFHFGSQVMTQIKDSPVAQEAAVNLKSAISMLNTYLSQLTQRQDAIFMMPIDAKSEFAIKAHLSEVRETLKMLLEVQGNLSQAPSVKVHEMNIQYNNLKETVVSDLCPMCKAKIIKKLEVGK